MATLLGASLLIPKDAFPALPLIDCEALPGLTPNVWQGLGVDPDADDQWENDANWSLGVAPLRLSNPYVCIPAGGTPVIGAGQEAQLVALDVAADGKLRVEGGGKLFLYGGALTPSTIRGRVEVIGATIGGPGTGGRLRGAATCGALARPHRQPSPPAIAPLPGPYRLGEELCLPGLPIIGDKGRIVVQRRGGRRRLGRQGQPRRPVPHRRARPAARP